MISLFDDQGKKIETAERREKRVSVCACVQNRGVSFFGVELVGGGGARLLAGSPKNLLGFLFPFPLWAAFFLFHFH